MVNRSDVYIYIECWQIIWALSYHIISYHIVQFFPRVSWPQVPPGQLACWAGARTEPEEDITNDQAVKLPTTIPPGSPWWCLVRSGAMRERIILSWRSRAEQLSVTVRANIYFSEADCEIVFIVLYFVHLEQPVRGNNVPLNPEESVENIWW